MTLPTADGLLPVYSSRDAKLLHPYLQTAWQYAQAEWARLYPGSPTPALSCTFRSRQDQHAAYSTGKSRVKWDDSLHNHVPAYAFDVFFQKDGKADWNMTLFRQFAAILKPLGLEWGGDWKDLVDGPHFQLPMTAQNARDGNVPRMLKIENLQKELEDEAVGDGDDEDQWRLVVMLDREPLFMHYFGELGERRIMTNVDSHKRRVYVDIRKEDY